MKTFPPNFLVGDGFRWRTVSTCFQANHQWDSGNSLFGKNLCARKLGGEFCVMRTAFIYYLFIYLFIISLFIYLYFIYSKRAVHRSFNSSVVKRRVCVCVCVCVCVLGVGGEEWVCGGWCYLYKVV